MATKHTLTREKRKKERRSQINGKRLSESKIAMGFIYHIACVAIDQWHENGRIHMYIELSTVVYCFFFVLLRLHLILRCAFVQREFSFCQTGREASSKIVEPLDGFFLADTVVIDNIRRFRLDSLSLCPSFSLTGHFFSSSLFPHFFSYALLVL